MQMSSAGHAVGAWWAVLHRSAARGSPGRRTTFDFEFRDALGATAYGVGDPGMWLATAREIVDGDRQSWFDAWTARADQTPDRLPGVRLAGPTARPPEPARPDIRPARAGPRWGPTRRA
jgi:hypothetical protein